MKPEIIPTVFATNKEDLNQRIAGLPKSEWVHVDFMDGKFVPQKGIEVDDVPSLERKMEAHLMVEKPQQWIDTLAEKGFKRVIYHIETQTPEEANTLSERIQEAGMTPVVAINPNTPIEKLFSVKTKHVLFMGVIPGKEGQTFDTNVLQSIRRLREHTPGLTYQVDGGVDPSIARKLGQVEVVILNTGSYVSKAENPDEAMKNLVEASNKGVEEHRETIKKT